MAEQKDSDNWKQTGVPTRRKIGGLMKGGGSRNVGMQSLSSLDKSGVLQKNSRNKYLLAVPSQPSINHSFYKPNVDRSFRHTMRYITLDTILEEMKTLKPTHDALLSQDIDEEKTESAQYDLLHSQNKKLGEELKRLNLYFNVILESSKIKLFRPAPSKKDTSAVDSKELSNAQKQFQNAEVEFEQVKQRVEQLSSPAYMEQLKERIVAHDERIKKIQKSQSQMKKEQVQREKALDKVIEDGSSEIQQEINGIKAEGKVTDSRLKQINLNIERQTKMLQEHSTLMGQQNTKLAQLTETAQKQGVSISTGTATHPFQEKYRSLEANKGLLEKTITLNSTRLAVALGEYTTTLSELEGKIFQGLSDYQLLSDSCADKKKEIEKLLAQCQEQGLNVTGLLGSPNVTESNVIKEALELQKHPYSKQLHEIWKSHVKDHQEISTRGAKTTKMETTNS